MLSLKDFLNTTNYENVDITSLDDESALAKAKEYNYINYFDVQNNQAREWLFSRGLLSTIKSNCTSTDPITLPNSIQVTYGDMCEVICTTLDKGGIFNVDPSSDTGKLCLFGFSLIESRGDFPTGTLEAFTTKFTKQIYPFKNTTLHDIRIIRASGAPIDPVSITMDSRGWVTINNTTQCEKHNPRLLAQIPSGAWERIANFMGASRVGKYSVAVPVQYRGFPLVVDNAYGSIEAA